MQYRKGSFVTVPNKMSLKGEDPIVQTTYFWIIVCSDQNGKCFPSISWLAEQGGMSETSVRRSIDRLLIVGILRKQQRYATDGRQTSNLYEVIIDDVDCPIDRGGSLTERGEGVPKNNELYPELTIPSPKTSESLSEEEEVDDYSMVSTDEDGNEYKKKVRKTTKEMISIFSVFSDNPDRRVWKMREVERTAAQALFDEYGLPEIMKRYETIKKHRSEPLCPKIYRPSDMLQKMPNMLTFLENHDS